MKFLIKNRDKKLYSKRSFLLEAFDAEKIVVAGVLSMFGCLGCPYKVT
jgi:hypothetical protein